MFVKYLAKFYLTINDPLPVLLGNEQMAKIGNQGNLVMDLQWL